MNSIPSPQFYLSSATGMAGSFTANGILSKSNVAIEPEINRSQDDVVTISPEARKSFQKRGSQESTSSAPGASADTSTLDEKELQQLQQLKRRDAQVRAHEQAHLAAAGEYARGGASFTFSKGPDGVSYAVAGKVGIDLSKERDPEETIRKMQVVRKAALAPLAPSAADRSIAARASAVESQARQELVLQGQEQLFIEEKQESSSQKPQPDTDESTVSIDRPLPTSYMMRRMLSAYSAMSG